MHVLAYYSRAPTTHSRGQNFLVVFSALCVGVVLILAEAQTVHDFHGPMLVIEGAVCLGVSSIVASAMALTLRRSGKFFRLSLAAIFLVPAALVPSVVKYQMDNENSSSRLRPFKDLTGCPPPPSLTEFGVVPSVITRDWVYHVKMSKSDFDRVLASGRFKRVDHLSPADRNDMLLGTEALSQGPPDEVYIDEELQGDVRTLRINASHNEGYLRSQHFVSTPNGMVDLNRR